MKLPIEIQISKKKRINLSLNWYRNAYFRILNQVKKNYCNLLEEQISKDELVRIDWPVEVTYKVFYNNKRRRDIMNTISVIDKFFLDWLVDKEIIEEDNWQIVKKVSIEFWWILDREQKPYVEANITKYDNEDQDNWEA